MPFIGNQPALAYTSFAKQDFTTSATTSYTLDNPVTNANELALFINFVRQEPTTAYSASGTSLTLTSATSASDDMYCVFLGKAVQTVNPPNASVGAAQLASDAVTTAKILDANVSLAKLSATGTKDSTTFLRGDNTFAEAGGANTPAFSATINSQTLSANTATLLQFDTMLLTEPSSTYNTSTYKFTPGVAGTYQVSATIAGTTGSSHTFAVYIKKNGSTNYYIWEPTNFAGYSQSGSRTITLDDNDYIQLYANVGMSNKNIGSINSQWSAFRIIE